VQAAASFAKGGTNVSQWIAAFIISFTVISVVAAGVFAAYWAITGILYAFNHQARPEQSRGSAVLVPSQTHAGGD
jgi:hypothetical protein